MKYADRCKWLLARIKQQRGADILDQLFVDDYAEFTGAKIAYPMWGAGWCALLPSDLRKMYREGLLNRGRIGLSGNWQPGFPKWVYSYRLSSLGETVATQNAERDEAAAQDATQPLPPPNEDQP